MRISDWSSDVCSSDLFLQGHAAFRLQANVDQRAVAFDRDDGAAQHLAFEGIVSAEGFVEQSRKALLRGGVGDRKSGVSGKRVSVRVDLGGRRCMKKKRAHIPNYTNTL